MHPSISKIAHISDVHLLAPRTTKSGGHDLRVRFLSFGRALDAAARRRKLLRSLATAMRSGADHIVISGDLTESGWVWVRNERGDQGWVPLDCLERVGS